jgi:TatD DNase family protein
MFIDSHCHLDASEFGDAASLIAEQARAAGVSWIIVPAVERANFDKVARLSETLPSCVYALGIHPMYVPDASEDDLRVLRERVQQVSTRLSLSGLRVVAVTIGRAGTERTIDQVSVCVGV